MSKVNLNKQSRLDPNIILDIDLKILDMFNTAKLAKQINQVVENLWSNTTPYYIFLGSAKKLNNYWGDWDNTKVENKEPNLLSYNYMKTPALNETEQEHFKTHPYRLYMKIQRITLKENKQEIAWNWNNTSDKIDWEPNKKSFTISFELLKDTNKDRYNSIRSEDFALHAKEMNQIEFFDWYAQHQQYLSIPEEIINKAEEIRSNNSKLTREMLSKIFWTFRKTSKGDRKKQTTKGEIGEILKD